MGRQVPEPAKTFDDFGVDEDILDNLKKCGYTDPTPIQKQAVPIMLQVSFNFFFSRRKKTLFFNFF